MTVQTIRIANRTELVTALRRATGGEVFSLAPGNYGTVKVGGRDFDVAVTFKSASTSQPAVFDEIWVNDSTNVRFVNLTVHHRLEDGELTVEPGIDVIGSRRISFNNITVHGTVDGNPGNDGFGFRISDSSNVMIYDSRFFELRAGGFTRGSDAIAIVGNDVRTVREGFDFQQVEQVLIEGNHFTDFAPEDSDHADAIQFWITEGSGGSHDVTIRDNVMLQGDGESFQGILVGAEGDTFRHSRFVVENNAYHGSSLHGISLYEVDRARVENNSVVSADTDQRSGINLFNVTGAALVDNIADVYIRHQSQLNRNVDNIDYHADGVVDATHLSSLFVSPPDDADATVANFALRAGGRAVALGAGFSVADAAAIESASWYTSLLIRLEGGGSLFVP